MPGGTRVLLLPERRRFAGQAISREFARCARRFRQHTGEGGESAQLQRHFRCEPAGWPLAALCRQAAFGDAGGGRWLLADPVHLQMEMRHLLTSLRTKRRRSNYKIDSRTRINFSISPSN